MIGIDIDAQGMVPQALSRALERVSCGHTAVYLTPTLHNPTTATMSAERRQTIVEICRQANVWIIEDGVYARGIQQRLRSRHWHPSGCSMSMACRKRSARDCGSVC
ncbi:aminotransferase class I/II-fold pyridoxal phosphate-dependent enzyme [Serratia ureilytica]